MAPDPHSARARLDRWLIEPLQPSPSREERSCGRLLAILSLAGLVAGACVEVVFRVSSESYRIDWVMLALTASAYVAGRLGRVREGGLLLVYALPLVALVRVGFGLTFHPLVPLTALVLPPLLAAMLLTRRDVKVLLAFELAVPLFLVLFARSRFPEPVIVVAPMALTAVVGVLVLAFMRQRDTLERLRQEDLRTREERFRALVANVPGVVYRVARGPEGRVLYVSDGIRGLAGLAPDVFVGPEGRALEDLVHPDDRKRARDTRARCLEEGQPYSLEYRIVIPDGSVRWVLDRGHPVGGPSGCVDGVLMDVSPQRSAIAEMERLAAIIEATTDLVGIALPDGRLRYLNRAGRELLGWTGSVLTREIRDGHPRWASEIMERLAIPMAILRGRWVGETALLDRDGREIPVSQVVMAHRSATGELEFLSTIARDLSERAAAEAASRDSQQRFRLLTSAAFEGIAVTEEGVLIDANEQLAAMLGLDLPRLLGRDVMDFVAPESRDEVAAHLRGGSEEPYEHLARRADGSAFPVEIRARTLTSGGRPQRVTALRDLTERKRAEDERIALERQAQHGQKLESLGVLAGGIAHDFNNLLVAVLGNLDLAAADLPPDAPGRRHLDQAVHAAQQGAGLARELLAYSGRGRFDVRPLDLSVLVDEMGQLLRAAVHKTIRLDLRLARPMPPIMGDASQLQQVVMNLIVNAAEAIGERPGTIALTTGVAECSAATLAESRLQLKPAPGRFASIEVTDDGCGMTSSVQQRLFDPFFSTKLAGRGLGMAAVQGIVQGHGGAVLVDSVVGRGAAFRVYLPLASLTAEPAAVTQAASPPAVESRIDQGGLVLVVDDEDVVREATCSMVERLGFSVVAATDGAEAVELFQRVGEHVAFVLLDFTMPVMDGPATLAELRRLRPDVTVLLASGFDQAETSERCGTVRPDGFLQKPYRLATLREAVEAVRRGRGISANAP